MAGWDFIYCVILNYPEDEKSLNDIDRLAGYKIFIDTLAYVIPFNVVKEELQKHSIDEYIFDRKSFSKYIYNLELSVSREINCNCLSYKKRCDTIESHRAGCKKTDGVATCRKKL